MKVPFIIACVFLLLSLIVTLAVPSTSFDFMATAYADDSGGDDSGGDSVNWLDFPSDSIDKVHLLEPTGKKKKGKKRQYTAADMKAAVEARDKGLDVVIPGPARGFEDKILNLAESDPHKAAKFLNKIRHLKPKNYKGMLNAVERRAQKIDKWLKRLKAGGAKPEDIAPLQNTYDAFLDLGRSIIEKGKLKLKPGHRYGETGPFFQSDVRLKKDVTHIATLASGIRLYSFRYLWNDKVRVGVMAQDLLGSAATREAVITMPDGFYAVNYEMLGLKMTTLDAWRKQGLASVLAEPASADVNVLPAALTD